ncbi:hypothetical protein [Actinomycetospora succinea]|uniref:hypothetical protein n=1 Tax=Actinomycetospora succinea TaxID=663603 RepID=UPI00105C319B|nr:hypothetical protein [Actinomycetospora succinea]
MEPTPIFADLVSADRVRPAAHDAGRPVTDLLRRLRDEAPGTSRAPGVGRVPGLLTFPARRGSD